MPEQLTIHHQIGGYVLGRLEPLERRVFEEHLSACGECRFELSGLTNTVQLLEQASPRYPAPRDLRERTLDAVERAAGVLPASEDGPRADPDDGPGLVPRTDPDGGHGRGPRADRDDGPGLGLRADPDDGVDAGRLAEHQPGFTWVDAPLAGQRSAAAQSSMRPAARRSPRRRRRLALGAAAGVALALAVVGGARLASEPGPAPPLELAATLQGGGATARADVTETGTGRVIEFRSDDLAILPRGEFYELWFVGPDDSRATPNRISAGTFHPDSQGRSNVTFAAAADPTKYPVLAVTAEPGDGNPRPSRREVLRSRAR